jgi:hypothetical protein
MVGILDTLATRLEIFTGTSQPPLGMDRLWNSPEFGEVCAHAPGMY